MDARTGTSAEPEVTVWFHFGFGMLLVLGGVLISFFLHNYPLSRPVVQSLENTVIDVFFLVSAGDPSAKDSSSSASPTRTTRPYSRGQSPLKQEDVA